MTLDQPAPADLPPAVSDLVAEGGKVLASDDAVDRGQQITHIATRRLHLSRSGRWIARLLKS